MPDVPEWRLDDLAAYDALREASAALAMMQIRDGNVQLAAATLSDALSADPFARADVDTRMRRLTGPGAAQ